MMGCDKESGLLKLARPHSLQTAWEGAILCSVYIQMGCVANVLGPNSLQETCMDTLKKASLSSFAMLPQARFTPPTCKYKPRPTRCREHRGSVCIIRCAEGEGVETGSPCHSSQSSTHRVPRQVLAGLRIKEMHASSHPLG